MLRSASQLSLGEELALESNKKEHLDLATKLRNNSLSSLYKKLRDKGVTAENLFELEDLQMEEMKFSQVERLNYEKAKAKFKGIRLI